MIIKALSKKNYHMFEKLVDYFTKDKEIPDPSGHNLLTPADDLKGVVHEFQENYLKHHCRHKGSIVCMHEIISPHPSDAQHVTPEMLYDLGFQYVLERAPDSLGFFQVHLEVEGKTRPHIHILLSGNEIGSSKQISLKKEEYREVKEKLKQFTKENYPELTHAFRFNREKKKEFLREQSRRRHNEVQRYKRLNMPSQKDEVSRVFVENLVRAQDVQELVRTLEDSGLKMYVRGKNVGVIRLNERGEEGRRYRLKTLDVLGKFKNRQMQWKTEQEKRLEQEIIRQTELDRESSKPSQDLYTERTRITGWDKESLSQKLAQLRDKEDLERSRDRDDERSR